VKQAAPLRGTQTLVGQMSWVFARPSLTLLEIAWRWLFGIPFLVLCFRAAQRILAALPFDSSGAAAIHLENPWAAVGQIGGVWSLYRPHVAAALPSLLLPPAIVWSVLSGLGRNLVLKRIAPGLRFRPATVIVLQAAWLAELAAVLSGWVFSMGWVASKHLAGPSEPDLVGYSIWAIFLTLGFFTLWALVSWPFAMAPIISLVEARSAASALRRTFTLGRELTSRLVEANLVMGIVKLMLLVLAMVFSSVLIPFSDEVGAGALHIEWFIVAAFYCVASDYFHVVRLRGYIEFWNACRQPAAPAFRTASD